MSRQLCIYVFVWFSFGCQQLCPFCSIQPQYLQAPDHLHWVVFPFLFDWFGKRHNQQLMKIKFFRFMISAYADTYFNLIYIADKGPKYPVPNRKYCSVIGVSLFYYHGMMNPMHGRRDKQYPIYGFKPLRDFQAAVMELGAKYNGGFKYQNSKYVGPKEKNNRYFNDGGDGKLSRMESGCRGYIHVQITVMYSVKSP